MGIDESMGERFVVVSIHDVSPRTWQQTRAILEALDGIGVHKRSLLVIPDHHEEAPLEKSPPAFREWLRETARHDEVCLHGYTHRADCVQGGPVQRAIGSVYTKGEGEFYQITPEKMARLLEEGLRCFADLGFAPEGFVPPAWLLGRGGEQLLQEKGFLYTTRLGAIVLLQPEIRVVPAPCLCYSTRSRWRRWASRMYNAGFARLMGKRGVLRVAVHPPDVDYPEVAQQMVRLTTAAARDRTVITYRELVKRLQESG